MFQGAYSPTLAFYYTCYTDITGACTLE